jgi:hypothetical protein
VTTPTPGGASILAKALLVGGLITIVVGVWFLAARNETLIGSVIIAAGLLDLGIAAVFSKAS